MDNAKTSLLGKVGSCGKNNSSNVLQKQGTLTPARAFSPFPSQLRIKQTNWTANRFPLRFFSIMTSGRSPFDPPPINRASRKRSWKRYIKTQVIVLSLKTQAAVGQISAGVAPPRWSGQVMMWLSSRWWFIREPYEWRGSSFPHPKAGI